MNASKVSPLADFLQRLDKADWSEPSSVLMYADVALRRFSDLAAIVGQYIVDLSTDDLADLATRANDGPTRFDILLYRPSEGSFECRLHTARRIFSDSVTSRPHMNRKGHWLLTVVLRGRMVVTNYRFTGFGDPESFSDVELETGEVREYTAGQSFILEPLQIHQIMEVDPGTATLSIRPTAAEGPMRIFHRHMHRIVTEDLKPMPQRVLSLARNLTRTSTPS